MRLIVFLFLLFIGSSCGTTKKLTNNSIVLNGTWIPIKQEMGGKELPLLVFEKQKLTIKDSVYTVIAESIDKGVILFTDSKMDIYGRQGVNTGKHFTAIYKVENGNLTICYNLVGDSYPEAFETKSKRLLFLSVYKKEFAN